MFYSWFSHEVTKIQTTKLSILSEILLFFFSNVHINFRSKGFFAFMLGYAFSNPNLGEGLCIFTSFYFPDSGLKLLNGSDFYFEWRDTENQQ